MFEERLKRIADRVEGSLAACLVAEDGIPVESWTGPEPVDVEALAAELVTQARTLSDGEREPDIGNVRHYSVTTDKITAMLGALNAGYFLMLVLDGRAPVGRGRYELRRAPLEFDADLV